LFAAPDSALAGSVPSVLFSPGDDSFREMSRLIARATHSLDLAMSDLPSQEWVDQLKGARYRGVAVRVLLGPGISLGRWEGALEKEGVQVKSWKRPSSRMAWAYRFIVVDGELLVLGNGSWGTDADVSYGSSVFLSEPKYVERYKTQFEKLWSAASAPPAGGASEESSAVPSGPAICMLPAAEKGADGDRQENLKAFFSGLKDGDKIQVKLLDGTEADGEFAGFEASKFYWVRKNKDRPKAYFIEDTQSAVKANP